MVRFACVFVSLLCLVLSLVWLAAELYSERAAQQASLCEQERCESLVPIEIAISLRSSMPRFWLAKAKWLAVSGDVNNSLVAYEVAARLAPSDPYPWANIVSLVLNQKPNLRNKELFDEAWAETYEHGPYEQKLHYYLIPKLLQNWFYLTVNQRAQVLSWVAKYCSYQSGFESFLEELKVLSLIKREALRQCSP